MCLKLSLSLSLLLPLASQASRPRQAPAQAGLKLAHRVNLEPKDFNSEPFRWITLRLLLQGKFLCLPARSHSAQRQWSFSCQCKFQTAPAANFEWLSLSTLTTMKRLGRLRCR